MFVARSDSVKKNWNTQYIENGEKSFGNLSPQLVCIDFNVGSLCKHA